MRRSLRKAGHTAMIFGDLNDPQSEIRARRQIRHTQIGRLKLNRAYATGL
jgi:hypothetical protein